MMTDKKNQHYLPQFYLRNFSYNGNKKQIGIFNLKNEFFFNMSAIKNQGSKNFFYGYDGLIEDSLSDIEYLLSNTIKNILDTERIPHKRMPHQINLLHFIALTDLRNPMTMEKIKGSWNGINNSMLKMHSKANTSEFLPKYNHDEVIKLALSEVPLVVENMADLNFKLLINNTLVPFISSDYPIVKYNQYLEEKNWKHGKTGYGNTGLQIFIPLNSRIMILFYDAMIY
jgi:hypothetical protein